MERRVLGGWEIIEARAEEGVDPPMIVEGYIAKYNAPTIYGGRKELVRAGAFDKTLRSLQDGKASVVALYHHGAVPRVLGNTANETLRLSSDNVGLKAWIKFPNTQFARDLFQEIKDKYTSGASFGFPSLDKASKIINGTRELVDVDLKEVTITPLPAYPQTQMSTRSWQEYDERVESTKRLTERIENLEVA